MQKNNRKKCTYDRLLKTQDKEYPIEIWGVKHSDNVGTTSPIHKKEYIKKREEKEEYWSQTDSHFIGIEFRMCNSIKNILKHLFKKTV